MSEGPSVTPAPIVNRESMSASTHSIVMIRLPAVCSPRTYQTKSEPPPREFVDKRLTEYRAAQLAGTLLHW